MGHELPAPQMAEAEGKLKLAADRVRKTLMSPYFPGRSRAALLPVLDEARVVDDSEFARLAPTSSLTKLAGGEERQRQVLEHIRAYYIPPYFRKGDPPIVIRATSLLATSGSHDSLEGILGHELGHALAIEAFPVPLRSIPEGSPYLMPFGSKEDLMQSYRDVGLETDGEIVAHFSGFSASFIDEAHGIHYPGTREQAAPEEARAFIVETVIHATGFADAGRRDNFNALMDDLRDRELSVSKLHYLAGLNFIRAYARKRPNMDGLVLVTQLLSRLQKYSLEEFLLSLDNAEREAFDKACNLHIEASSRGEVKEID